jgi:hypothetical protein
MTPARTAGRLAWALMIALAAFGCRAKSPVERLLADLESHVEDRDAEAVGTLLAPELRAANNMTKTDTVAEMKRYFFAYESLDIHVSDVVATGEPPTKIALRVDMEGQAKQVGGLGGLVPGLSAWRFELDLVEREGRLLINGARWERVDKGGP